jgi:hypothetical protein
MEKEVKGLVKELDDLTKDIVIAPDYSERRPRRSTANYAPPQGTSKKRKREGLWNEGTPRKVRKTTNTRTKTKLDIARDIDKRLKALGRKEKDLKARFLLHEGGFSAKARAHKMGESKNWKKGCGEVTTWFKNVTLDGKSLGEKVYKPFKKISEESSDLNLPSWVWSEAFKKGSTGALSALEKKLVSLVHKHGPYSLTRAPRSVDREGGQTKNMANTNASGYAMLADVPNWEGSRWEWLHIRAASLGGATNGSNLVVGTRDANTHMMPFEANIRLLANIVKKNPNYAKLLVLFSASGQDKIAKHKVDRITIEWKLVKASNASKGAKGASGEAQFNPLSVGESISKTEIAILEQVLKEKRQELKVQNKMQIS